MLGRIITAVCAACLISVLTAVYRIFVSSKASRGHSRLPGPRGWPLLGYLNAIESPSWVTYRRWSDEYSSDILGFSVLGTRIVIANSIKVATELLETRSTIYSDRPAYGVTMLRELVGFSWNMGLMRYGPLWRDSRKAFAQEFHPQAIVRYRPAEIKLAHKLLRNLIGTPGDFRHHVKYFSGRLILHIAYGLEIKDRGDPNIAAAERAAQIAAACLIPGSHLVDLIPILKYVPEWFPGAGFKRQAREWRKEVDHTINAPFAAMKARGDNLPSDCAAKPLMEKTLDQAEDPIYAESVMKRALATMYIAGADTTTSTLDTFFLAMTLHPDILVQAQRSVDRACPGRLPDFSDYDSLYYIHAIVKECLRWHPVIAMNLVHMSTEDDVYEGHFIPKGSLVLANNWAILHDSTTYLNPEAFVPGRFLRSHADAMQELDLELDPNVPDPTIAAFGFGRRICPGRHMAYESLWIAIASIVATFDITKAVDEHGQAIEPSEDYTDGFMSVPKPFKCSILPRSPAHAAMILAAVEQD